VARAFAEAGHYNQAVFDVLCSEALAHLRASGWRLAADAPLSPLGRPRAASGGGGSCGFTPGQLAAFLSSCATSRHFDARLLQGAADALSRCRGDVALVHTAQVRRGQAATVLIDSTRQREPPGPFVVAIEPKLLWLLRSKRTRPRAHPSAHRHLPTCLMHTPSRTSDERMSALAHSQTPCVDKHACMIAHTRAHTHTHVHTSINYTHIHMCACTRACALNNRIVVRRWSTPWPP
jgi:hypothetical protein